MRFGAEKFALCKLMTAHVFRTVLNTLSPEKDRRSYENSALFKTPSVVELFVDKNAIS